MWETKLCFLRLRGSCCLRYLFSNPGQDICFSIQVLHAGSSYSANKGIWDGEKGKNVEKVQVLCCLAEILTGFKIIKFTMNTCMWPVKYSVSFLRNRMYRGIVFFGKRCLYGTCNKKVNWGSFWTECPKRLAGAAFLRRHLCCFLF